MRGGRGVRNCSGDYRKKRGVTPSRQVVTGSREIRGTLKEGFEFDLSKKTGGGEKWEGRISRRL